MNANRLGDTNFEPAIWAAVRRGFSSATEVTFPIDVILAPPSGVRCVFVHQRGFYSSVPTRNSVWQYCLWDAENLAGSASRQEQNVVEGAATEKDLDWFFSDRESVRRYAGRYVAIAGKQVVGVGTASEAYEQARQRGVKAPLLLDLRRAAGAGDLEFGL